MSDVEGWQTVGEFEDAEYPPHEEAYQIASRLGDDDKRTVDTFGNGAYLECRVEAGDRWVTVATLVGPSPHDFANDDLSDVFDGTDYRVVNVNDGDVVIEKLVVDDD